MIGTLQAGGTQDTDLENTRDELFYSCVWLDIRQINLNQEKKTLKLSKKIETGLNRLSKRGNLYFLKIQNELKQTTEC